MVLFWIILVLALIGTNAEGEFCVFHSPSSLTFIPTSDTFECLLKEIFCAALGLSVEQNAEWKGMFVMDPFNTPEAVVEVHIDGVSSLGENAGVKTKVFPLSVNEYEPDTFKGVKLRILQREDIGDNTIVNIKLSEANMLDKMKNVFENVNVTVIKTNFSLKLVHLKPAVVEDRHFINELANLRAFIGKVQAGAIIPNNMIDFYSFRFVTLHALSDFYGPISLQTKEAKKLLGDALQELRKAFVKAYDGSVLVTVVTTDVAHTRRSARSVTNPPGHSKKWPYEWLEPPLSMQKLSLKPEDATKLPSDKTTESSTIPDLTEEYEGGGRRMGEVIEDADFVSPLQSADSAAIFNILLWFGVVLSFSMLAIIYACMDMDPGRDTIIYRMTTMRTKKDL